MGVLRTIVGPVIRRLFASPRIRGRVWKRWYDYLDTVVKDRPIWFLNYGLSPLNGPALELRERDEPNRLSIQLYHRVAAAVPLKDALVLEISCGRGGGARFISDYLGPRRVVGLDRTMAALTACRREHDGLPLSFVSGDAIALPFRSSTFDAVVNVEASHCYPDFDRFLAETHRMLKPGGHLLFADLRKSEDWDSRRAQMIEAGFRVVAEQEITAEVVRSLDASHEGKKRDIEAAAPWYFRRAFMQFAGTRGSRVYEAFRNGTVRYMRFVLEKPVAE